MPSGVASRGFRLLWWGGATSAFGSQVGAAAMPLIGVLVLGLPALQVGVLAACAMSAPALLALPAGVLVDRVRRRRLMIVCDLLQACALLSVPVAGGLGVLGFGQLAAVAVLTSVGGLLSSIAAGAHLPTLVGPAELVGANARMEATGWLAALAGPALGGLLIGLVGAVRTLLVDVLSFLVGALALALIRPPEPVPARPEHRSLRREVGEGLRFVRGHRPLRRLVLSNAVLSWAMMLLVPVELLLVLRELAATPVQFGLLMALPCLGGLAGSALAPGIARRWGVSTTLRISALLRAPTVALPALAPAGGAGLLVVGLGFTGLLFTAGIYNSVQNAYQQRVTPDPLRGRVAAASKWLIGLGKPVAPILGGVLAGWLPLRAVFVISAVALLLPVLLLDRDRTPAADVPAADVPTADVPATDVPTADVPAADVPAADVPAADVPAADVPTADVPTADVPTADVPTADVPTADVPTTDVPTADVPTADVPTTAPAPAERPA